MLVVADGAFAIAPAWDDRDGADVAGQAAEPIGIVALVTKQVAHAPSAFEEGGRGIQVADVAGCEHQRIGAAGDVGECVDLDRPAAARAAERLC